MITDRHSEVVPYDILKFIQPIGHPSQHFSLCRNVVLQIYSNFLKRYFNIFLKITFLFLFRSTLIPSVENFVQHVYKHLV